MRSSFRRHAPRLVGNRVIIPQNGRPRQRGGRPFYLAALFPFCSSRPIKNEEIVTVTSEHAILTGGM